MVQPHPAGFGLPGWFMLPPSGRLRYTKILDGRDAEARCRDRNIKSDTEKTMRQETESDRNTKRDAHSQRNATRHGD